MKLQSWIVIFSIIIIPIVLVMSLYIQVQINYINLQSGYDTVLNNATYDAIKAFQINELNSNTQNIAEEKMRDVEASIKSFYNSLATNFGQSGYSSTELSSYIPALVYTLYDGYYIYTKYNNVYQQSNENRNDNLEKDPNINLNATNSTYGLKPYTYYSARYKKGDESVVINYTLDNYITVFYSRGDEYKTYSGYLIDTTKVNGATYNGANIEKEDLKEFNRKVDGNDGNSGEVSFKYITNSNMRREKAYYDGGRSYKYNVDGTENYADKDMLAQTNDRKDDSAQRYLSSAVKFTEKMKNLLKNFTLDDIQDVDKKELGIVGKVGSRSLIPNAGEMDLFNDHKIQVIKNSITSNLKVTVAKYNENSEHTAKMPTLNEKEWQMLLNNTCLISFMQGQKIGNGYYMGYSIVNNNMNREFVDPKLIYILDYNMRNIS